MTASWIRGRLEGEAGDGAGEEGEEKKEEEEEDEELADEVRGVVVVAVDEAAAALLSATRTVDFGGGDGGGASDDDDDDDDDMTDSTWNGGCGHSRTGGWNGMKELRCDTRYEGMVWRQTTANYDWLLSSVGIGLLHSADAWRTPT